MAVSQHYNLPSLRQRYLKCVVGSKPAYKLQTWSNPSPLGLQTGSRKRITQGRDDKVLPPLTTYFRRVYPSTPLDSISQDPGGEQASASGFISFSSERTGGKNGGGGEEERYITAFCRVSPPPSLSPLPAPSGGAWT